MTDQTFPCAGNCGRTIKQYHGRKTRLCKTCQFKAMAADPDRSAKAGAAIRKWLSDPIVAREQSRKMHAGRRALFERDPAARARMVEQARRLGASGVGGKGNPAGSPSRILAGRKARATKLAWCPPALRDEYVQLIRRKGMPAAEARVVILDKAARLKGRKRPTHDEQMAAMRNGAGLILTFRAVKADPDMTLGGVASGML